MSFWRHNLFVYPFIFPLDWTDINTLVFTVDCIVNTKTLMTRKIKESRSPIQNTHDIEGELKNQDTYHKVNQRIKIANTKTLKIRRVKESR